MAYLYGNFLSGTITDSPNLGSAATSVNSAEFASLPAVASPNTMWIILDPLGVNGAPEIVSVTAHTASATSATITRAQQSTSARVHPTGTQWVNALTTTDLTTMVPAGTIVDFYGSTAPAGWMLCDGTVYTSIGAATLYPNLFANAPSLFSGTSNTTLTVPDLRSRVSVGVAASGTFVSIGATGGTEQTTLTASHIPQHLHGLTSHTGHTVTNGTVAASGHSHTLSDAGQAAIFMAVTTAPNIYQRRVSTSSWTGTHSGGFTTTPANATAAQTLGVGLTGSTDANSSTTTVSVGAASGNTDNYGTASPTAVSALQPYMVLNKIIKVH